MGVSYRKSGIFRPWNEEMLKCQGGNWRFRASRNGSLKMAQWYSPYLSSGKHTTSYWKWPFIDIYSGFFPMEHGDVPWFSVLYVIYSGFFHWTWWCSIVFCMFTRPGIPKWCFCGRQHEPEEPRQWCEDRSTGNQGQHKEEVSMVIDVVGWGPL